MRVPFSWLKDFVEIPDPPKVAAEKLRDVGVPVEKVEWVRPGIRGVFSGKIVSLESHPNADKLRIAQLDFGPGKEKRQIITGAANVAAGDLVPVAVPQARLAGGKVIQESTLRGLPSHGMMCSAAELDLDFQDYFSPAQREGVLILDPQMPAGLDLSTYFLFNEAVLILEPFANRPDFLSIFGIAREAAAVYGVSLRMPELLPAPARESGKTSRVEKEEKIRVIRESAEDCPRYLAQRIIRTEVKPSPLGRAIRLQAAGTRPINNLVDVTNYVLLEFGQPLHAFDFHAISDQTIRIRRAKTGESLHGIDGKKYPLSEEILVIADGKKPVALAGILGGKETEISPSTHEVLLESATFNPQLIRRASANLGIRTESSKRFEKGLDPVGADWGSRRACCLFRQEGAVVAEDRVDVGDPPAQSPEIQVHLSYVQSILGIDNLSDSSLEKILKGLDLYRGSRDQKKIFSVSRPPLRLDIREEIDAVEEVARHFGYNQIPARLPKGEIPFAAEDAGERFEEKLRDLFQGYGLTEVIHYSLGDPDFFQKFSSKPLATIENPLTEDRKALRPFLFPGLLLGIQRNFFMKQHDLSFFELGKIFERNGSPDEKLSVAVAITGVLPWGKESGFFSLKGILDELQRNLHLHDPFSLQPAANPNFHPYRFALIQAKNQNFGFLGELHPVLLESLGIERKVYVMELAVEALQRQSGKIVIQLIPQYPDSRRDISLLLDQSIPAGSVMERIRKSGGNLVEEVTLFDVYQGPQVPPGKKSLAFSIHFRAAERTLTDEEVDRLQETIRLDLQSDFQAVLRG